MKTRILLLIAVLVCVYGSASSQVVMRSLTTPSKTVEVGQKLTPEDIYRIFGTPESKSAFQDDEYHYAYVNRYQYRDFTIVCLDNEVYEFVVKSNQYMVTVYDKYSLKVGDRLANFKNTINPSNALIRVYNGVTRFYFRIPNTDIFPDASLMVVANSSGMVTSVAWHVD